MEEGTGKSNGTEGGREGPRAEGNEPTSDGGMHPRRLLQGDRGGGGGLGGGFRGSIFGGGA